MADGQGDDDDDEGVPEEKRLADDVRADAKVERREIVTKCIATDENSLCDLTDCKTALVDITSPHLFCPLTSFESPTHSPAHLRYRVNL
jgi:hypothetical protein